jgi:hypothetical protein
MSDSDPITALNEVLSEIIDVVQEVKQARRRVDASHALRPEVDQLFDDVLSWAQLLMIQDEALGVSPLERMPSVAGRRPPNLWPSAASDGEVCDLLDQHLGRLEEHVADALTQQTDPGSAESLGDVQAAVTAHRQALRNVQLSDPS